ncbi:MAG TPA: DUF4214 domain-containing protein, partial [Gemmataceae bacterium]|nr:DUF4214 domain-containing protein [Gemmataceae bacterium]
NDDAVIDVPSINVTSGTPISVNSLLCSATLTLTGSTFSIANVNKNSSITTLVENAGTLQLNANTLFITGGSSSSTLIAAPGSTITFGNTQFSMNQGSSLSGAGLFFIAGGTFTLNVDQTAPTNFQLGGGMVDGTGALTIANSFTWSGGGFDGAGTTTVTASSTVNITGALFKYVTGGHVLNLAGTTTWTGSGELDGSPGSTINNSGTFTAQNDSVSGDGGAGAGLIFNNTGTFTKSGTTGTTAFQGNQFNNSGTVNVQSGTLSFSTNYNQTAGSTVVSPGATLASSGTVNILAGSLSGTGTVSADVSNAGTVSTGGSTGTLTIARSFTQTATGTLNVKIGSASQFDTIAVGGAANLGGTLNISLQNGFVPTAGQSFKILTFASSNGDFATKTGLTIGSNLSFNPVIDPADFTLVVSAPNPGTVQFSAGTYTANDSSGVATITVARNGGSQGTVSVNFATSDGSATAGVSYAATSGTLTFATGVTSQTFTIQILVGAAGHGNQTVNLTINGPTGGATLGSQNTAVLTLIDDSQHIQAGQVQFASAAFSANVTGGSAVVTVSRTNGSTGTVTVQYATSDGTAQAGVRYTATSGTLLFANGVTSQTITIPLLNPPTVHGNQTVNVTLSNATGGATLGTPTSAVLTIVDNNVGDDILFVSGLYHDILGRAADTGGLTGFQQSVDAGRNPVHGQFALAYVVSTENRTNYVTAAYTKYLGRTASAGEVGGWVTALQQGLTQEQLIVAFVGSAEYFQKHGNTNSTWLDHAYLDILGRARDPGSQGYLNQLNSGAPLSAVATALVDSTEYRMNLISQVYTTYLQRQAGSGDVQVWLPVISQTSTGPGKPSPDDQFLGGVIGSQEYFVTSGNTELAWATSLYTKILNRNPDSAGLTNTLVSVLNGFTATRQTITSGIGASTEAETKVVASYYTQYLGRTGSPGELSPWVTLIQGGGTREQVTAAITSSQEYFQKAGGTNSSFVDKLYLDLLGRARGATETSFVTALNNGTSTLLQVATAIVHSTEYYQRLVNQIYSADLGRQGSLAETAGWVQQLQQGTHDEQVLAQILSSGEYFLRSHTYP